MLYFDHNATSPLCGPARQAWLEAHERFSGNPSSPHRLGARAEAALDEARARLAGWLGCAPGDLVWTSGATESANAVFHHAAQATDGEAWVSSIEHPCVLEAARRHFAGRHRLIPAERSGRISLDWLEAELRRGRPALVAIMAANNETGVLEPWREAAAMCRDRGVAFLCDAAQWLGRMPAEGLGAADFVTGCAHKFGGPQGVGFLKVSGNFRAQLVGGPQEGGRRAGTENLAGVLALVAALEAREEALSRGIHVELEMRRMSFEQELTGSVSGLEVIGAGSGRLWNTVSVVMPELADCRRRWVVRLDRLGFAVSTGSACASGKEEPSHVLAAMGYSAGQAGRALRFSAGWETTEADWCALAAGLRQAFKELAAV